MLNILYLFFVSPVGIFLLILNCFFIILFKKYLGPISTFYVSIFFLFLSLLNFIFMLYFNLSTGSYVFIDLGHIFFSLDCINSNFILIFDNLTLLLSIIVSILTIVALFFGIEYMARELFINRLIYLLNLFATSVIFLFCVYDFFLILVA
jgi:NADH:ubiquinone oxidoreductase subunit 5 (subunit L)/multisubunit Na+/H+ antiporter MnhA subunit